MPMIKFANGSTNGDGPDLPWSSVWDNWNAYTLSDPFDPAAAALGQGTGTNSAAAFLAGPAGPAANSVTTVTTAGSGLVINLEWDASVANAPASWKAAIQTAAQMIEAAVTTPITINIAVGYGEIGGYAGGQEETVPANSSEGGTLADREESYSTVVQQLTASATSAADREMLANLPATNPFGTQQYDVSGAQLKAFGVLPANGTELDGEVGFATNWPSSDLIAAALHEMTHAMGRNSGWGAANNGSDLTPMDLTRYSAPGVLTDNGENVSASNLQYFSLDGGKTVLADYSNTSDYGDWATNSLTETDPFDAYVNPNSNALTPVDLELLDVLGYTLAGSTSNTGTVVSNALVSAAAGLQASSTVSSFSIADTAADVQAGLTALAGDSKLTTITLTDASKPTLTLVDSSYTADTAVLAKITSPFNLDVTGASAAGAAALQATAQVTAFTVSDSEADVQSNLAALGGDAKLISITLTDSSKPSFSLSAAAFAADAAVLALIISPYFVTVSAASVAGAAALQANAVVNLFGITDTAANVLADLTTLSGDSKLSGIVASAALAGSAETLQANAKVTSFSISDTAADVQADLAALAADSKVSSITLTDLTKPTITVSSAAYSADAAVLAKIVSPFTLTITGGAVTTVAGAAALQANASVATFNVADTAADVQAGLASLAKDSKLSQITLTDTAKPTLTLSYSTFTADTAVLGKIVSPYFLSVTGAAVANAAALQANTLVTSFSVSDNATNVTRSLSALDADGKLASLSVSGTTGGDTLNLTGSSLPVTVDLSGDYASWALNLRASSLSFINPPDSITLGSGAATIDYVITPLSGIEEIANFQFGLDKLMLNLDGAPNSVLTAFDTKVGGVHAISIYSLNDPNDGVVLTGMSNSITAQNLLSSHTSFTGGYAVVT